MDDLLSSASTSLPQHIPPSNNYSTLDRSLTEGFKFHVTYLGSVEILISMKVLDFNTRKEIARECIHLIKRKTHKKNPQISQYISNLVCREHSDTEVYFELNDRCLELKECSMNFILVKHEIAQISFVCGGDEEFSNCICYIAKDVTEWRACYVVMCDSEIVQNILTSMDYIFNSQYKKLFNNDVPSHFSPQTKQTSLKNKKPKQLLDEIHQHRKSLTPKHSSLLALCNSEPENCNDKSNQKMLQSEIWYHGSITRSFAETLIKKEGDFLVRDSQKAKGIQFVLSGVISGQPKHLLLVDPDGKVRTKDQIFENIPHLINHHWRNRLPIISADSTLLVLRRPVRRKSLIDNRPIIN